MPREVAVSRIAGMGQGTRLRQRLMTAWVGGWEWLRYVLRIPEGEGKSIFALGFA